MDYYIQGLLNHSTTQYPELMVGGLPPPAVITILVGVTDKDI